MAIKNVLDELLESTEKLKSKVGIISETASDHLVKIKNDIGFLVTEIIKLRVENQDLKKRVMQLETNGYVPEENVR